MFEIITQDTVSGPCASEAESISIVIDCMNSFANLGGCEIQLSHMQIRTALQTRQHRKDTNFCSIKHSVIMRKISWKSCSKGRSMQFVARLEKTSPFLSAIRGPLWDIRVTIQFAVAIGVQWPIVFNPLFMLYNKQGQSANLKRGGVLAVGERYEQYIDSFSQVKSRLDGTAAVGIQISLGKFVAALASFQSSLIKGSMKTGRSYGYWSPRQCDVYVVALPSDLDSTLLEQLEVSAFL
ncbi:hypothetical protein BDY19DRAFT_996889 [Irpex rosettiformis]|uniref:Uncharacterized protein n=1 Tax=Irpex rosettiformis TaxID=378272 RepID=A0ACB8TTN4_9APHY|nr:hypothetical protein BDY19DRAFT_996889 [Irpex rosettiformis]